MLSMITVHHLNNSRSQRVLWLLEELGLEYKIEKYQRDPKTLLAPDSLRKVHPLGKSPVITDGEFTLAESGAILEYLVQKYGAGKFSPPPETQEYMQYLYWMHYAEGSAMPPLLLKLVFEKVKTGAPLLMRPVAAAVANAVLATFVHPQVKNHLRFIDSELAQRPWFLGESFSAADVQMSFPLEGASVRFDLDKKYPNISRYLKVIHARPAYQRALERGGPFELGL